MSLLISTIEYRPFSYNLFDNKLRNRLFLLLKLKQLISTLLSYCIWRHNMKAKIVELWICIKLELRSATNRLTVYHYYGNVALKFVLHTAEMVMCLSPRVCKFYPQTLVMKHNQWLFYIRLNRIWERMLTLSHWKGVPRMHMKPINNRGSFSLKL